MKKLWTKIVCNVDMFRLNKYMYVNCTLIMASYKAIVAHLQGK